MNVFKFRVVLDSTADIFRDIEIRPDQNFEEFYDSIIEAFDFRGGVMSSFYMSTETWDKGQEINLLDMSEKGDSKFVMNKCLLNDYVTEENQHMILVYDFMRMWCFYIELVEEIVSPNGHQHFPRVAMKFGDAPDEDSKELAEISFMDCEEPINDEMELVEGDELEDGEEAGSGNEVDDMFDELSK